MISFAKILAILALFSFLATANATIFDITNRCSYPVWAAALPGGGRRLNSGQVWQLDVGLSAPEATIWGRTRCNFNSSGHGQCETGGCNGALRCKGPGSPPTTLAKFSINERTLDYVILTLVQGFNIPVEISPTTNVCPNRRCSGPVREQCPRVLRAPGGCNSPCTVFGTNEYCCTDGNCGTTTYSRFFKEMPGCLQLPAGCSNEPRYLPAGHQLPSCLLPVIYDYDPVSTIFNYFSSSLHH